MSQAIRKPSRRSDLRILWHLLFRPVRGTSHAERLEGFYAGQAEHYDAFRQRLLHGRQALIESIPFRPGDVWVDIGAGTGSNLTYVGPQATELGAIHLVDLSASLLAVAQQRIEALGWTNTTTHLADATTFALPANSVDVVTFSYALTMIPDWFEALRMAERMLRPGGRIAVVDFYISRKHVDDHAARHGWLRRSFWSHWFAADNVFLSGDHLAMLKRRFEAELIVEQCGKVPYMPLLRAPYYRFVGQLPGEEAACRGSS